MEKYCKNTKPIKIIFYKNIYIQNLTLKKIQKSTDKKYKFHLLECFGIIHITI